MTKYNCNWDNGLTQKLFVKFLKKYGLMDALYAIRGIGYTFRPLSIRRIGDFFIEVFETFEDERYFRCSYNRLQLSQLWRFYLLENVDEYPNRDRDLMRSTITSSISHNGYRESKEIRELFEKYNITNSYDY